MAKPDLSVKQQREAKRAEKVAELKRKQQTAKRNRIIGTVVGSVLALGLIAALVTFVVTNGTPPRDPDSIDVAGVETWEVTNNHVEGVVDYQMDPPAGGDHNAAWLNCGVYSEPQQNEYAVHALEHGAVWVTYDPDRVDEAGVQTLRDALPTNYVILSPYPGLESPVVASAWGTQVMLDGVDDERLRDFVDKYWRSADVPEPNGVCTGAIDGPGLVS